MYHKHAGRGYTNLAQVCRAGMNVKATYDALVSAAIPDAAVSFTERLCLV